MTFFLVCICSSILAKNKLKRGTHVRHMQLLFNSFSSVINGKRSHLLYL
jgi:hypothetical protein